MQESQRSLKLQQLREIKNQAKSRRPLTCYDSQSFESSSIRSDQTAWEDVSSLRTQLESKQKAVEASKQKCVAAETQLQNGNT